VTRRPDGGGGSDFGGGLLQGSGATISVKNSLIALNRIGLSGTIGPDCYNETSDFVSNGHNLLTDDNSLLGVRRSRGSRAHRSEDRPVEGQRRTDEDGRTQEGESGDRWGRK
jgi:hypothetical protein